MIIDPITLFVTNIASGVLANYAADSIKNLFRAAVDLNPALEGEMASASSSQDIQRIFQGAAGILDANAGSGAIDIDSSLLTAIRGARFDHAHGTINISNSTVQAPVLVTGGSAGATGQTVIGGNTSLKSQGTEIKIGTGASIKISGNASIKQN